MKSNEKRKEMSQKEFLEKFKEHLKYLKRNHIYIFHRQNKKLKGEQALELVKSE